MIETERDILLGSLLGDGGLRQKKKNSYILTIGNTHEDYIQQLHAALPSFNAKTGRCHRQTPRVDMHSLRISFGPQVTPADIDEVATWYKILRL